MSAITAQLYGGPFDGTVRAVRAEINGSPPLLLETFESPDRPLDPNSPARRIVYRLWGLSASGLEWLYVHPGVQVPPPPRS